MQQATVITDDDAKHIVANNVARLIAEKGWSQQKLADATGENKMMISRVVRAEHCPGVGLMARIAEALEVTVDELLSPARKKSYRAS
jgi:transcriptional regulator with XRE-family HTH domain